MNDINDTPSLEVAETKRSLPDEKGRESKLNWMAVFEIAVFIIAYFLIDYYLFDGTRFREVEPHPFWIVVLVASVQYGTRMGVVSAVAASALFLIGNIPEQTLDQNIHQWFFSVFKLPILWIVVSIIIGEISIRRIRVKQTLLDRLEESEKRETILLNSFKNTNHIKQKLEVRIAGQSRTVRKILKAARDMENLEPDQILRQSQVLIDGMLEPVKFSVYFLNNNQLSLLYAKGWNEGEFLESFRADNALYQSVVVDWKTLSVAQAEDEVVLAGQGVLAGPIIEPVNGEVIGMLKIEEQDFSKLSHNLIKDFNSACQWIGSIYGRAN